MHHKSSDGWITFGGDDWMRRWLHTNSTTIARRPTITMRRPKEAGKKKRTENGLDTCVEMYIV